MKKEKLLKNQYLFVACIKEFAKKVAQGVCQLCENPAPFSNKIGKPFLEVHHIHYLSRGDSDCLDNVIALCPNCRRMLWKFKVGLTMVTWLLIKQLESSVHF
ncbi:HNH endonuclease [Psychrobacillus sp. FSL H8-0484]|uniref:HNH endonuclease n=1 Tax=Psychrobacillus sp. FSL H8-0484 TaxID=2921390 RepID=UPI004046A6BE